MDVGVLGSTYVLLFLAELGDKTQLVAMTLAHRYRPLPVMVGAFTAFVLLNLLAVLIGEGVAAVVPRTIVLGAAGGLFLWFAYRAWCDAVQTEDVLPATDPRHAWMISFSLIFVAELGDKTQLAMVAMAAQTGALWAVFVGGTLALWSVAALGILAGRSVLRRLPPRLVHRLAAGLFFVFGMAAILAAVLDAVPAATAAGA